MTKRITATKHKRIITVVVNENLNNFDCLGNHYHLNDKVELRFHNQPMVNVRGTEVGYNFDIMLTPGTGVSGFNYRDILPAHRYVELRRYDKFSQAIQLLEGHRKFFEAEDSTQYDTGFRPVPTWLVGPTTARNYANVSGKVVLKPLDGARGVGQFVIDTDKIQLDYFQGELPKCHDHEKLDEFLAKFQGAVTYHTGSEKHDGEGLSVLREQGGVVQSVIPDVLAEYRLITGHDGVPVYCQKRTIRDPSSLFPQATGGGAGINPSSVVNWKDALPASGNTTAARDMFLHLCKTVVGPMNSIDLFVTTSGEWGFFEFCNQFGIAGISAAAAEAIHHQYMETVVNRFLEAELLSITA